LLDSEIPKPVFRPKSEGEAIKIATTVLKRRDLNLKYEARTAQKVAKMQAEKLRLKRSREIRPLSYFIKKDTRSRKDRITAERSLKFRKKPKMASAGALLVVRNNDPHSCRENKEILKEFFGGRTGKFGTGRFIRATEENIEKLMRISRLVYFGKLSRKMLTELIQRRATVTKAEGEEPIPLKDNRIVEEQLGSHGILCVADIVEELHTGGEQFELIRDLLGAIEIGDAMKGFKMTPAQFVLSGDMKDKMDEKVAELLGV